MSNNVEKIENLIARVVEADPNANNREFVSTGRAIGQSILWGAASAYINALVDLMRIDDPNDDYFGGDDPESVTRRNDARKRGEARALWSETYIAWASQYHDSGHRMATTAEDIVDLFSQPNNRPVTVVKSQAEEHMELYGFATVEEAEEDLVFLAAPTESQLEIQAKRMALIKANREYLVRQLKTYLGKGHSMPLNGFDIPARIASGICIKLIRKLADPANGHITRVRRRGARSILRREKLEAAALCRVLIEVANDADDLGSLFAQQAETEGNNFEVHTAAEEAAAHRNVEVA